MSELAKFGMRVRALRHLQGLTQESLSEKIDRAVSAVSAIERGETRPSFETLLRLSRALEVPLAELFNFEGAESETARVIYLTTLSFVAKSLPTEDLIVAAEIVKMLAMARPFAKGKVP